LNGPLAAVPPLATSLSSGLEKPGLPALRELIAMVPSAQKIRQFEDALEERSVATRFLAPWVGLVIKGVLHGGDEQAYFGNDGWLFYRPSVEAITGPGFLTRQWQNERRRKARELPIAPQPDPVKALVDFHRQLSARGIALVVLPIPGKETIRPEKLTSRWSDHPGIPENASFRRFKAELEHAGINVFDPAPLLVELKRSGADVYLKTDTHWSPSAMEQVANKLSGWLRERALVPSTPTVAWQLRSEEIHNSGDITAMLNLPSDQTFFPAETLMIRPVATAAGQPWEPRRTADVLVMGDSFCNIYSRPEMGWGETAGFAEHLNVALGRDVDRIVINAGGASSTREELVRRLATGQDPLAGKQLVILEFATRELAFGDWKLIELPEGQHSSTGPAALPEPRSSTDEAIIVQGHVKTSSRPPQPGSVPYRDCVIAVHLTQTRPVTGGAIEDDLLIYTMGMLDNRWLPATSISSGTNIKCRLRHWSAVEDKYGSVNRAELDDLDLLLLPTYWAEEMEVEK
jgi:alginate O-acetyltransferase complex protein AlgJ